MRWALAVVLSAWPMVAAADCKSPQLNPREQSWAPNTTIKVNISTDFSQAEREAIFDAFRNWDSAQYEIGSGIVFQVEFSSAELVDPFGGPPNTVQVNKRLPVCLGSPDRDRCKAETGGEAEFRRKNAYINVHPNLTNLDAMRNTMAHEVGHTFGLGECPPIRCGETASVMCSGGIGHNDPTVGRAGPSPCDTRRAAFHYKGGFSPPFGSGTGNEGGCSFCSAWNCHTGREGRWECELADGYCCFGGFISLENAATTPTCPYLNFWGPEQFEDCQETCNDDCRKKSDCGDLTCMPFPNYCWKCPVPGGDPPGEPGPPGRTCDEMGWYNADELDQCEAEHGTCGKKAWCDYGICQPWPYYCWKPS